MATEVQELPEQGEIVIATVSKVMDHGAYVSLDEYNGIQGFLHISEIAPGWIRSVSRHVKEGEKKVLIVKKVNPGRGDIDLSLKQVTNDQKKRKLLEVKKIEKGKTFLYSLKEKGNISDNEIEKFEDKIYTKYDYVYDAFLDIARNGPQVIKELKIPKKLQGPIEEVCSKIKIPSVEIRGVMEVSCPKPDGVEIIKKTLSDVTKSELPKVQVTYLGAPKYRLSVISPDFKSAERALKPIIENIQKTIEKSKGTFKFSREGSRKTREG